MYNEKTMQEHNGPHIVVDCGGTHIRVARVQGGELLDLRVYPTRAELAAPALKEHFLDVLEQYVRGVQPPGAPASVNIAIAGQIDSANGIVRSSPNLPTWHDVPLAEWVAHRFGVPVYMDNDVRAAALGECIRSFGGAVRDMVCLFWGTGVGGGILVDGKLLRGIGNAAGEAGHMVYRSGGRLCGCGKRGCYEAYADGWAIGQMAVEAVQRQPDAALGENPSTADVFRLAAEDHPLARKLRNDAAQVLAELAASLVVIFNPERLVIGAGIANHYPRIREIVSESVSRHALPVDQMHLQIGLSRLGDEAALWGAAGFSAHIPRPGGG